MSRPLRPIRDFAQAVFEPLEPKETPAASFQLYSFEAFDRREPTETSGETIQSAKWRVQTGDVLFAKLNPRIPRVWMVGSTPNKNAICSTEFVPLRMTTGEVLPAYLEITAQAPQCLVPIQAAVKATTKSHQRVRPDFILDQRIPVPSHEEQLRTIARVREAMERVEEIESLQQERLRDSERLLGASLTEVFRETTSKHPPRTLGSVLKDCRYGTSTKCRAEPDHVAVLRIPNVSSGVLSLEDLKYCARDAVDEASLLSQGDLLIIRTNGSPSLVGRTVVYQPDPSKISPKTKVSFASYLIRLRFDESRCIPEFVRYYLASSAGRQAINRIRRSSAGQSNINSANIKLISLPLPGIDEQRRIVERLTEIERASCALAIETDHNVDTKSLRTAILRQAFSGKL